MSELLLQASLTWDKQEPLPPGKGDDAHQQ